MRTRVTVTVTVMVRAKIENKRNKRRCPTASDDRVFANVHIAVQEAKALMRDPYAVVLFGAAGRGSEVLHANPAAPYHPPPCPHPQLSARLRTASPPPQPERAPWCIAIVVAGIGFMVTMVRRAGHTRTYQRQLFRSVCMRRRRVSPSADRGQKRRLVIHLLKVRVVVLWRRLSLTTLLASGPSSMSASAAALLAFSPLATSAVWMRRSLRCMPCRAAPGTTRPGRRSWYLSPSPTPRRK